MHKRLHEYKKKFQLGKISRGKLWLKNLIKGKAPKK
jgi:hypothetical protein